MCIFGRGRPAAALALCAHSAVLCGVSVGCSFAPIPDNGTVVAGTSVTSPDSPAPSTPVSQSGQRVRISGSLGGEFSVQAFPLGPGAAGERWNVRPVGFIGTPRVVALFDENDNLLSRRYVSSSGSELSHVLRASTSMIKVGVMTPSGGQGGGFQFDVSATPGQGIPGRQPQVVYLNFAGGSDVKVHRRSAISFGAFDAGEIDPRFAQRSRELRELIVEEIRADFAGFDVIFISSDESGPPAGPHSVVHFGGESPGLLGLADAVDEYNRVVSESAIVYSKGFALYRTMQMSMEQMAVMIGNVASHEVGHLLGLYHTTDANDLMDTSAGAWELAGPQTFGRARLERSVFAVGYENSPALLAHGVGALPETARSKSLATARAMVGVEMTESLRRLMADEMTVACGTCVSLDQD